MVYLNRIKLDEPTKDSTGLTWVPIKVIDGIYEQMLCRDMRIHAIKQNMRLPTVQEVALASLEIDFRVSKVWTEERTWDKVLGIIYNITNRSKQKWHLRYSLPVLLVKDT